MPWKSTFPALTKESLSCQKREVFSPRAIKGENWVVKEGTGRGKGKVSSQF